MKQKYKDPDLGSLTDRQREIYRAWMEHFPNETECAKSVGISIQALRKNLYFVAKKGIRIDANSQCEQAPAGWEKTFSTLFVKYDEDGNGILTHEWPRISPIKQNINNLFEYFGSRVPATEPVERPKKFDDDLMLEWALGDAHIGMLAWGKETGDDYDLKIARSLILDCASDILSRAGSVKETTLVLLGDNWHSDFYGGYTEKSKNMLDVDSRYPKMIRVGSDIFVSAIEILLQRSQKVRVFVLYGNHDKQTSTYLPLFLWAWFRNEPRVEINMDVSAMRLNFWGCTAFGYQHGDATKPPKLCGDFLNRVAKMGEPGLEFFNFKQAHLHKEYIDSINGVRFEIVPSIVASDAFAAGSNFVSERATFATTYHKKYGRLDRYDVTPHALRLKKEAMEWT